MPAQPMSSPSVSRVSTSSHNVWVRRAMPMSNSGLGATGDVTIYVMRASVAPGGVFQKFVFWKASGAPDKTGSGSGENVSDLVNIGVWAIL